MADNMKLKLKANLKTVSGRLFVQGVYEGDSIPQELMDEFKAGSSYIDELSTVPTISKSTVEKQVSTTPVVTHTKSPPKATPKKPDAKAGTHKAAAKPASTRRTTKRKR